jgi:hypothetical protein
MTDQTAQLSPAMKHYYKNKENILTYYHSYYQQNKERIKQQRRERYARKVAQSTTAELVESTS